MIHASLPTTILESFYSLPLMIGSKRSRALKLFLARIVILPLSS